MNPFKQERIEFAKAHKIAERQLSPIFRKALIDSYQPVITWVERFGIENVPVDMLIRTNIWNDVYIRAFELIGQKFARKEYYWQRSMEPEAEKAGFAISIFIDEWTRILREYALQYTYGISQSLNQTTIDIINSALAEGDSLELDRQGGIRWFTNKIKNGIKERVKTFSRTEATRIANLGKDLGATKWIEEQGGEGYKLWLGRVVNERQSHLDVNDTIIRKEELFTVGDEQAMRPGDRNLSMKESINCRCTVSYMTYRRYNQYVKRGLIVNGKVVGAS